MDIEILKRFCATDVSRHRLEAPFSQGEWTFATNGHIAVRVPRMKAVAAAEGAPDCVGLFSKSADLENPERDWVNPPEPFFSIRPCADCAGQGFIKFCDHTDGGYCKRCAGREFVPCEKKHPKAEECFECDGKGEIRDGAVLIEGPKGQVKADSRYIELIRLLPNPKIALHGNESDRGEPLCFRFDGGDGLLMPMRK